MMTDKVKISFVLPGMLQGELKDKVNRDGYDMKSKSRWVAEAVEDLLDVNSLPDLIKINDSMHGFEKLESVTISKALKRQLDEAIIRVRKVYPDIEGVQSRILRTAIMQRIIRNEVK